MKYLYMLLAGVILLGTTTVCTKKTNADESIPGICKTVTITDSAPGCGNWGIVVNGTTYTSANIPDEFKQNGLSVCAVYTLYEDQRACVCCGGTWADIKSMKRFIR